MSVIIYLEGGGDSKELHARCREGFRKLLERCDFQGRMPRLVACGGRNGVFNDFTSAHNGQMADFIAMWVDSEDLLSDLEKTWAHLKARDQWKQPARTNNEQVLFMTTCMETWIVADRDVLSNHYGNELQESALPPLVDLEGRGRHDIQSKLEHATRKCTNAYAKGKRSFEVLGKLTPATLRQHLPSFVRICRILNERL